jgi:hypothetical protein
LAAFSTDRAAERTVRADCRIAARAWRFAALAVLRDARVALRADLRALPAVLRRLRRAVLRADALRRATFLRTLFLRAERRLPCVERRRADFRDFFLAAM